MKAKEPKWVYPKNDFPKLSPSPKGKKVKRTKLPTVKSLEKKLDKVHSEYIRLRDPACVTCGSVDQANNGHLFTRRAKSTRWDDLNCARQCWPCNFRHEFDPYPYTVWFLDKYGREAYDRLHFRHRTIRKFTRADIEGLIDEYTAKVKELAS